MSKSMRDHFRLATMNRVEQKLLYKNINDAVFHNLNVPLRNIILYDIAYTLSNAIQSLNSVRDRNEWYRLREIIRNE